MEFPPGPIIPGTSISPQARRSQSFYGIPSYAGYTGNTYPHQQQQQGGLGASLYGGSPPMYTPGYGHGSQMRGNGNGPVYPPTAPSGYMSFQQQQQQQSALKTPPHKQGAYGYYTTVSTVDHSSQAPARKASRSPVSPGSRNPSPPAGPKSLIPSEDSSETIDHIHRRPSLSKPPSSSNKHRKLTGSLRGSNPTTDYYTLPPLPPSSSPPPTFPTPPSTLTNSEYRLIFSLLSSQFRLTAFNWLSSHQFRIPRRANLSDHLEPDDRELTEYVQIIKSLIESREIPRSAVRDERISELVSVMEGAAEIRHVDIHVSRKRKPDQRVLGFVAAASEFCWLVKDWEGAERMNALYREWEGKMRARQMELGVAV